MARAFRATSSGYRTELETHERRLLSGLCADIIELLSSRGEQISAAADEQSSSSRSDTRHPKDADFQDAGPHEADDEFAHFRRELAGLGENLEDLQDLQDPNGLDERASQPPGLAPPQDAALMRLLPDASEDPEQAGQLRRLTESSLRESKLSDLRTTRMLLESTSTTLSEDQAQIFGRALNDIRLTLAARLDITTDEDAERIHHQPRSSASQTTAFMAEVYSFTTWLQQSLFTAMLEVLPEHEEG